jgi:hypothetical protein
VNDDDPFDGEGQARRDDPETSKIAAALIKAKANSARVALLRVHARHPGGLTDEEAATFARLPLTSEYATRCSELKRGGMLEDTHLTRAGSAGAPRMVRRITTEGVSVLRQRSDRAAEEGK